MPASKTPKISPPAKKSKKGQAQDLVDQLAELTPEAAAPPSDPDEMLLVCTQDPFLHLAQDVAVIAKSEVPSMDADTHHIWDLTGVMEMNPPRVFKSWVTRTAFVLDLKVNASASAPGGWGGYVTSGSVGKACRLIVSKGADGTVKFSVSSFCVHAPDKSLPIPDAARTLVADLAFSVSGTSVTAAAVAVVSSYGLPQLTAGSSAGNQGLYFDQKWQTRLTAIDGQAVANGNWSFQVMKRSDYEKFCATMGWPPQEPV